MAKAILVAGLGFGDEGKGTVVESLVARHQAGLVVRYTGGCQAQHTVVLADGRHHTFSQFGSGTLLGARTFLSKYMLVDPFALMMEADHLRALGAVPLRLLAVDRDAPVVTFYHRRANWMREEARGAAAHGSCGRGIGECRVDSMQDPDYLRVGDLGDVRRTEAKLARGFDRLCTEFGERDYPSPKRAAESLYLVSQAIRTCAQIVDGAWLPEQMQTGTTVFEGAQGVLLDQDWGFQPHTTWSDTTYGWAWDLLGDFDGEVERVGVTRAYHTRHGAGPFPTECPMGLVDEHNVGGFAGLFRTGALDLVLLRYAVRVLGGVDSLAVTHLDRRSLWPVVTAWRQPIVDLMGTTDILVPERTDYARQELFTRALQGLDPSEFARFVMTNDELLERLTEDLRAPVGLRSYGTTVADKVHG